VERADDAVSPKPPFVEPCASVRAGIVDDEDAFGGAAEQQVRAIQIDA
jgi:hypothetical protein